MSNTQNGFLAVVIVLVVLLGLLLLSPVFMMGFWGFPGGMGGMMGGGMMGGGMMGGSWGGAGFGYNPAGAFLGALLPIAFIGIIIVGAYYLLSGRVQLGEARKPGPLEIVKERYAKGEITQEEFLRMKEQLGP